MLQCFQKSSTGLYPSIPTSAKHFPREHTQLPSVVVRVRNWICCSTEDLKGNKWTLSILKHAGLTRGCLHWLTRQGKKRTVKRKTRAWQHQPATGEVTESTSQTTHSLLNEQFQYPIILNSCPKRLRTNSAKHEISAQTSVKILRNMSGFLQHLLFSNAKSQLLKCSRLIQSKFAGESLLR